MPASYYGATKLLVADLSHAQFLSLPADIPKLSGSLAELVREWVTCSIDAVFYAWQLRSYTKTDKYTAGIIAYVLGAGIATSAFAPSFGSLAKKEQELEGAAASVLLYCRRCLLQMPAACLDFAAHMAVAQFVGALSRYWVTKQQWVLHR
jgi:ABC transporter transmembrane region 2